MPYDGVLENVNAGRGQLFVLLLLVKSSKNHWLSMSSSHDQRSPSTNTLHMDGGFRSDNDDV